MDKGTAYDLIGQNYSAVRRADTAIVNPLDAVLLAARGRRVRELAVGTRNYGCALAELGWEEPALEPSADSDSAFPYRLRWDLLIDEEWGGRCLVEESAKVPDRVQALIGMRQPRRRGGSELHSESGRQLLGDERALIKGSVKAAKLLPKRRRRGTRALSASALLGHDLCERTG